MRFLTAGESHGKQLTAIIEGVPSGFDISIDEINNALQNRQAGYGRGKRMEIEKDQVKILSGVRHGKTLGSPITLVIENKDNKNWGQIMSEEPIDCNNEKVVTKPRPGHADLSGGIKYSHRDLRNILERSSARETAIRVAVGAIAKQLLNPFEITFFNHVVNIGGIESKKLIELQDNSLKEIYKKVETSEVRCVDSNISKLMKNEIDKAKKNGDSLGGTVEIAVFGLPVGIGSHVHWDRKLDGRLGQAVLSIQAFKGVEIGLGNEVAFLPGSKIHDEIYWNDELGYYRSTNNAGGIEGGISNGQSIIVRGTIKPIPTLYTPLKSIDIETKEVYEATVERSDVCAVPAAGIVAEYAISWEIANLFFDKFSGDSLQEIKNQYNYFLQQAKDY